jgi:sugar/nucleoside kinase (ribokinase family)
VLIVGPVTFDRQPDGSTVPGGGVSYAARVAAALGIRARILTVGARDADLEALDGHVVTRIGASETLTFAFSTVGDARRLKLEASPNRTLTARDMPRDWPSPRTIILAPLLPDDVDIESFLDLQPDACALLAQGLQRLLAPNGTVIHRDEPSDVLRAAARDRVSIFLSEEEVAPWSEDDLDDIAARAQSLVITHGPDGAEVRTRDHTDRIKALPAEVVDTTGAGDVFAAALILAMRAGEDVAERLAAGYAAASVERRGPAALPACEEIAARAAVPFATDRGADA